MRAFLLILLLLAGCTGNLGIGTTTSRRPALLRPAVQPDGVFWDALEASRANNPQGLLILFSPAFVHGSFVPRERLTQPTSQDESDEMRNEIEARLTAAAARNSVDLAAEKLRLALGYVQEFQAMDQDTFIDVGKPQETISFTDEFNRARGPNRARVTVTLYPAGPVPEGFRSRTVTVNFVQDGHRWLIDSFDPDPKKGAFVWTR